MIRPPAFESESGKRDKFQSQRSQFAKNNMVSSRKDYPIQYIFLLLGEAIATKVIENHDDWVKYIKQEGERDKHTRENNE